MTARHFKMKVGKRGLQTLAIQALGTDFLKGVIELVTNCDDSYTNLEASGQSKDKALIEIEFDRRPRTKKTVLRVIDHAEGMTDEQMKQRVGEYGEDTSGHAGRGVFGMGLKDTINAFGNGKVVSFKDGMKYECCLHDFEDLEVEEPVRVSRADRAAYRNSAGGTIVEIVITEPRVRIPQMETLSKNIKMHVCLRPIVTDPNRQVSLRDISGGTADKIVYCAPEGESLVVEKRLDLEDFPEVSAFLTVKKATANLTQSGSFRIGGILITSKRTCHEATLFGFDDDPFAARLFGELRCDQIYDYQVEGEHVVDKNRDGLKKDHPLTKALIQAARRTIEEIVKSEKQAERKRLQELENADTSKRFRSAIESLNQIAKDVLRQPVGPGSGKGRGDLPIPPPRLPLDGFEFVPDEYRIVVAEKDTLKLRVQVDGTTGIAVGDKVNITCDNPNIRIIDPSPSVPKLFQDDPPISIVGVAIEGDQANAEGFVTATLGQRTAIAAVQVVSSREQKEQPHRGGLFREIRYEEKDIPVRARFDRSEGVIYINTVGPSVDLYFGPGGDGQGQPANQVLVAELVTQLACQEIIRVAGERKTLDIAPGVDRLDAVAQEVDKLKAQNSPKIHRALVIRDYRRK